MYCSEVGNTYSHLPGILIKNIFNDISKLKNVIKNVEELGKHSFNSIKIRKLQNEAKQQNIWNEIKSINSKEEYSR